MQASATMQSQNFFPPDPLNDPSNKWRNMLVVSMLLVGAGIAGGIQFIHLSPKQAEFVGQILPRIHIIEQTGAQTGGDITIEPPVIPEPQLPELVGEMPAAETFSAKSIVVKDRETGVLLYSKNPYDVRPIASVTKLMSALVLLEKNIDWAATTTVIGEDSLDAHMYAGDTYTLKELWDAALIGSSNKAILTLAHAIDWPVEAFVERMNQKALELGMSSTRFVDPTGLGDENASSASDIAMLLEEALLQPAIEETLAQKELTLYSQERKKSHHLWNTNWLLLGWIENDFAAIPGGKTGYTLAAGYNFVVQIGNESGHEVSVVVLGAESHEARFTEAKDIAQWAFENYRWPTTDF